MAFKYCDIHKKLQKYLNSEQPSVLIEKHYKPSIVIGNNDVEFYFRYHSNGQRKYVLTLVKGKFYEEVFYNEEGLMHRDYDLLAWISTHYVCYYRNGERHRGV